MSTTKYQLIWMEEIINVASQMKPKRPEIIDSLQKSFGGKWASSGYFRIVNPDNANNPGAEWQFQENIILTHEFLGIIVLDVLKGDRIGGIEFLNLIDR
jgi:hypothetical protein